MSCGCRDLLASAPPSGRAQLAASSCPSCAPVTVNVQNRPWRRIVPNNFPFGAFATAHKIMPARRGGRGALEVSLSPAAVGTLMVMPVNESESDGLPTSTKGIPIQPGGYWSPPGNKSWDGEVWGIGVALTAGAVTGIEYFEE